MRKELLELYFEKKTEYENADLCIKLSDGTVRSFPEALVSVRKEKGENICNLLNIFGVNRDKINGDLVIRNAQSGDIFRNAESGSKLSRLFIDMKIPRKQRAYVPVVADNRGVLWVYGIGLNAGFPAYDPEDGGLIITVGRNKMVGK